MMSNDNYTREILMALKEVAKELKSINKNLGVIAQDVRNKQNKIDNTLIKG